MLSGIFATPTLRNCSGPPSASRAPAWRAPAGAGAPPKAADSPLRASRAFAGRVAPPLPEGAPEGFSGPSPAGEGPRRSGGLRVSLRSLPGCPPGPRCSSRRALRRSRFRCPLGFPFSLSPLLYIQSINRRPHVSSPSGVSFATFSSAIRRRRLPSGKTKGSSSQLPARNLPERNLPTCHLTTQ